MTTVLVCAAVMLSFIIARRLAALARHHPFANPVLIAALLVGAGLWFSGLPLARFEIAAQPLRWALAPAIVGLGALIYERRVMLRAALVPLLVAIAGGSLIGIVSAVLIARLAGLDEALAKALSVKSVTSPFAIALMEQLDGSPALAAGLVIITGIVGAILLPPLLRRLRLDSPEALGVAMGQAAHIVGTDALTRRDPHAAALSGLAMALAGLVTSLLLPLIWPLLF